MKEKTEEWKTMEMEMQSAIVAGWSSMKLLWKTTKILIPILLITFAVYAGAFVMVNGF